MKEYKKIYVGDKLCSRVYFGNKEYLPYTDGTELPKNVVDLYYAEQACSSSNTIRVEYDMSYATGLFRLWHQNADHTAYVQFDRMWINDGDAQPISWDYDTNTVQYNGTCTAYMTITLSTLRTFLINQGVVNPNTTSNHSHVHVKTTHIIDFIQNAIDTGNYNETTTARYQAVLDYLKDVNANGKKMKAYFRVSKNTTSLMPLTYAYSQNIIGVIIPSKITSVTNGPSWTNNRLLCTTSTQLNNCLYYFVCRNSNITKNMDTYDLNTTRINDYWSIDDGVVLGPEGSTSSGVIYTDKSWKYYPIL